MIRTKDHCCIHNNNTNNNNMPCLQAAAELNGPLVVAAAAAAVPEEKEEEEEEDAHYQQPPPRSEKTMKEHVNVTTTTTTTATTIIKDEQILLANGTRMHVLSACPPPPPPPPAAVVLPCSDSTSTSNCNNNNEYHHEDKPPIVFIHGSLHGPWCWKEHFLPYFVGLGYPVAAIGLRGTHGTRTTTMQGSGGAGGAGGSNGTTSKKEEKNNKTHKVQDHVDDLEAFFNDGLPNQVFPQLLLLNKTNNKKGDGDGDSGNILKPVVVCHSLGGILFMKYLENLHEKNNKHQNNRAVADSDNSHSNNDTHDQCCCWTNRFAAWIFLSSVPPSGLSPMISRMVWQQRRFGDLWTILRAIPMKGAVTDPALCRQVFFRGRGGGRQGGGDDDDGVVSEADLQRYQEYMQQDSHCHQLHAGGTVDMADLGRNLPKVDSQGRARFIAEAAAAGTTTNNHQQNDYHQLQHHLPPIRVLGVTHDLLTDHEALLETAAYFGLASNSHNNNSSSSSSSRKNHKNKTTMNFDAISSSHTSITMTLSPIVMIDSYHDSMLGENWKRAAIPIEEWLEEECVVSVSKQSTID